MLFKGHSAFVYLNMYNLYFKKCLNLLCTGSTFLTVIHNFVLV